MNGKDKEQLETMYAEYQDISKKMEATKKILDEIGKKIEEECKKFGISKDN